MAALINSFVPTSAHIVGGQFNATPPALTDGQCSVLEIDASGALKVNVVAGGGSGSNAAAGPTGSAVPADADYQGVNIGGILTGVTGLALGAMTKAPTVAIVDGSGNQITSFGGGTQYADNAASGATPTGTLSMGWDSVNSKIRALKVDASQNLEVVVNAPLPAGTNVIGHVIVDSGSVTVSGSVSVSNFPATQNVAGVTTDGTTTETNFLVVGGETNDATAQYQPIPLGPTGRSIIVEGTAAPLAASVGNPVLAGGTDASNNVQNLPIGVTGAAIPGRVVLVGGDDVLTSKVQELLFVSGAVCTAIQSTAPAFISNSSAACFLASGNGVAAALATVPYVYNTANNFWVRLTDAGASGTVGVGGAAPSGSAKIANPVQVGGVFNSTQPLVTSGQVVEAQSTAKGALIVAPGADSFNVEITDGVNGLVSVKPASTAAISTDSALVVAISPNSGDVTTQAEIRDEKRYLLLILQALNNLNRALNALPVEP